MGMVFSFPWDSHGILMGMGVVLGYQNCFEFKTPGFEVVYI